MGERRNTYGHAHAYIHTHTRTYTTQISVTYAAIRSDVGDEHEGHAVGGERVAVAGEDGQGRAILCCR